MFGWQALYPGKKKERTDGNNGNEGAGGGGGCRKDNA